ncbi:ShlB/FhaC/HecB family hemolysin secretion/activation protein [Novosphingobium piscinae]|uniref:ShlB/FhaC/HecB family hemolysin secretion/activation protein n=1 Tax=Novosphingobium piscinae TaxID=1507448 RepID=A0A7X1KPV7_9SPHN|nr:ShlB/FhaC/HecB family hemolysin secretion/activation protein [Novosphingobium piscinae]MBC2668863.1 ShlB/FhaC/HecB family hemolysin secretion/activation protein [Novosphingobium piscinae]
MLRHAFIGSEAAPARQRRCGHVVLVSLLALLLVHGPGSGRLNAQPVLPSQVTPPTAAPMANTPSRPALPDEAPAEPRALPTEPDFPLSLSGVQVEGGFASMSAAHGRLARRVPAEVRSLSGLFALARALEQDYARAGFVFARVIVPPQRLGPGATARIVVVDGFIEAVDLAGVPGPVRSAVRARLEPLINQRQLQLAQLERAVLLAGELAGVTLRSALAPGDAPGGVRLTVAGSLDRWQGRLALDNRLPVSLGTWQWNGSLVGSSLAGRGEQVYAYVGSQTDLARHGWGRPRVGSLGLGLNVPLNAKGLALGADLIAARTEPDRIATAPRTVGRFTRAQLALQAALERRRSSSLDLRMAIEKIVQTNAAPDFATRLSHDDYAALRLGLTWRGQTTGGVRQLGLTLSRGLGGTAATTLVPHSRDGADNRFTSLQGHVRLSQRVAGALVLDIQGRALTGLGRALFLSEQFALSADNGVSGFAGGSFTVDQGATLRGELILPPVGLSARAEIQPYAFAAGGAGAIARPTAVEAGSIRAGSVGLGARGQLLGASGRGTELGFEVARQFTDLSGRTDAVRATLTLSVRL